MWYYFHKFEIGDAQVMNEYPYRYDLYCPKALRRLAEVLYEGSLIYGESNWLRISYYEHLNHALGHLIAALENPNSEDLSHAFCRVMFALELFERGYEND